MSKKTKEETLQVTVPPSVKRQVRKKALEHDETLRTFVLKALQDRGIRIPDEELRDRRKGE